MSVTRKSLRLLLATCSSFLLPGMLGAADSEESVRQQFIGDYELVSYVQFPAAGGEIPQNYIGRLSYDKFGNMAGLGMPRDLPERAANSTERVIGGFAYWGRVSIDVENQRVIHHVEGSPMVPGWVGGDNIRYYEFEGDLLRLSLKDADGRITGTLTWRRLR